MIKETSYLILNQYILESLSGPACLFWFQLLPRIIRQQLVSHFFSIMRLSL